MGSLNVPRDPAKQLGSAQSSFRLNQIDKIRALGVGNHVSLPQIVVCGDQSAGKSSVLERLTEIPFPRQDGLCTRFATEIILRHAEGAREMVATIHADKGHDPEAQKLLEGYRKNVNDFSDLPDIIDEVSSLMGLRGYGDSGGKAFSLDVLRIEVKGPTGLQLTIVDLPGLISVANEDQSDEDVKVVHRLVESYLESSRTIIMAVIQAGNDIANQPIVQKARKSDPDGVRTIGIITKPDLINSGTEHRIARLANNEDNVKLKLGFFLLKNPSPENLASGMSPEALARDEADFFAQTCWRQCGIDPDRVGSARLKKFMQDLLQDHIEREIPKVKAELRTKLDASELKLRRLGKPRSTAADVRSCLIERSMALGSLTRDALQGHYLGSDSDFFKRETRLRALVHQANTSFAAEMRVHASKRRVVRGARGSVDTDQEMLKWVKSVYQNTRGLELSGSYNHTLLTELFQEQASRWFDISDQHVKAVLNAVHSWVQKALDATFSDEDLKHQISLLCQEKVDASARRAHEELSQIWADECCQPITYNHYFTDNIQKCRNQVQRETVQKALHQAIAQEWHGKLHISNNLEDIARITTALQSRVIVDMEERACQEALDAMNAYYKVSYSCVSMKTFVDNVCRQVVERHIMRPLSDILSPMAISEMSDAELLEIGSESAARQLDRQKLEAFIDCLRASLKELSEHP
ncbi:interferon-induced GTP-binding protein Mx2 [Plectosphaerella cucumerina]|uniref:Interferon-induced GTP-binding protein Mx2 n=1 Tax=Plectosphaerella cucumerina TaxID=40658 RepID=A0A8K0TAB2_9PEZI|nr:interferon-induced GTP-binding protein Mx2 [Plectosphaerella cucumerina]